MLLMKDTSPLCFQAHLFIQHVLGSRVECRLSSHGSSHAGSRNREAVVCCYLVQTILIRSVCPVFLARQPCWTLLPLGWVCAYQSRGPWQSHAHIKAFFHCLSLPHLLPFYFLNVFGADWHLVQGAVSGLLGIWLKRYKSRLVARLLFL
jgi:hypothetical protein